MAHIDPWARIDVTSLSRQIYKLTEPLYRENPVFAMLKKRGKMTYNAKGKTFTWRVLFRQHTPNTAGDMTPTSFVRTNVYKTAGPLPYRSFNFGEAISKFEKLACDTKDKSIALVNWLDQVVPQMTRSMTRYLGEQVYNDGHATGNESLHGFESWSSYSGLVSNSMAGSPNDTYAGLSTSLGNYGGAWTAASGATGGWPNGSATNDSGDFEYAFFSPIVGDYTNTNYRASTKTWPYTWREATRYGKNYLMKLQGKKVDTWLVDSEMMRQAQDSLDQNDRVLINDPHGPLADLGFETIKVDGVEMVTAYKTTANVAYGICWDALEVMSMQPQLLGFERDRDISTSSDLIKVDFWGSMRIETPAFFVKLAAIS